MMGRTHALTGFCAGLLLAPLLGQSTLITSLTVATVTAGAALLPDLDHRSSTATRLLGPVTQLLSWLLRSISVAVYRATRGPRDERTGGEHRALTHTVAGAAATGVLVAAATSLGGPWICAVIAGFALLLAVAALGRWMLAPAAATFAGWLIIDDRPTAVLTGLGQVAGWLGIAVTTGMIVHSLGDMLTNSGAPLIWPIPIRGETWFELRPPLVHFATGGLMENGVIAPACTVLAVWMIPGLRPAAMTLLAALDS